MHVFVTGGSGLTGPTVVAELIASGHAVTALARSDAAAARLTALGATPHRGSLDDLDSLRRGAEPADGVLHMAFGGDFADPDDMMRRDRAAIEALGKVLEHTGKPFVSTSGTLVMPPGRLSTEHDEPLLDGIAGFRVPGERACLDFAAHGVRASVLRLAPTVHGPGEPAHGFIGNLVATARRTGRAAYIGDGTNRWPAVDRRDAATLFRLALEKATAGSILHGVAEPGVPFRSIAETIARGLGIPAVSLTPAEATEHFGNRFMATIYALDAPVSSILTQQELGWSPRHWTLVEDLTDGDYLRSQPRT
ncbi:SDR family oxidoreductase [Actinoplanes sp. N902-109]|uniref:SDR family oxidoreductase n=1 Tax=Actinoplanes sp. (strain N902-109) TaxID=649831 RepID=UPI0003294D97|nr:SDR family oxidoreductase [Actinoplanes sp. N902-109]AGL19863.1 NAD-dependent epimerase/dehydratase [Actinoplanes sp. N902-109]